VSEAVVELFEMVDVDHRQAVAMPIASRSRTRGFELLLHEEPISDTGQGVGS